MKEKISITLSKNVLERVDRLAGSKRSRSIFIESILRRSVCQSGKATLKARDLELINDAADRLNLEAAEVLGYQAPAQRSVAGVRPTKRQLLARRAIEPSLEELEETQ